MKNMFLFEESQIGQLLTKAETWSKELRKIHRGIPLGGSVTEEEIKLELWLVWTQLQILLEPIMEEEKIDYILLPTNVKGLFSDAIEPKSNPRLLQRRPV